MFESKWEDGEWRSIPPKKKTIIPANIPGHSMAAGGNMPSEKVVEIDY